MTKLRLGDKVMAKVSPQVTPLSGLEALPKPGDEGVVRGHGAEPDTYVIDFGTIFNYLYKREDLDFVPPEPKGDFASDLENLIRQTRERMDNAACRAPQIAAALSPAGPHSGGAVLDLQQLAQGLAYDQIRLYALLEAQKLLKGRKKR